MAYELAVDDFCALVQRQTDALKRVGPKKYFERTRPTLYRAVQVVGQNTYRLAHAHTGVQLPDAQHGRNLVKLDFPTLPVEPGQRRTLEIYDNVRDQWVRHVIERFATDGRLQVQRQTRQRDDGADRWVPEGQAEWIDPSEKQYRWVA